MYVFKDSMWRGIWKFWQNFRHLHGALLAGQTNHWWSRPQGSRQGQPLHYTPLPRPEWHSCPLYWHVVLIATPACRGPWPGPARPGLYPVLSIFSLFRPDRQSLQCSRTASGQRLASLFGPCLDAKFSLKFHYAKKRFSIISKCRHMHRVLNVDEIKN
jgi:hypothetical protein